MRQPCIFEWCGKPGRVLKHTMANGTNEPFFCSQKHAAYWALITIHHSDHWCKKGKKYHNAEDYCDACEPKDDEG